MLRSFTPEERTLLLTLVRLRVRVRVNPNPNPNPNPHPNPNQVLRRHRNTPGFALLDTKLTTERRDAVSMSILIPFP